MSIEGRRAKLAAVAATTAVPQSVPGQQARVCQSPICHLRLCGFPDKLADTRHQTCTFSDGSWIVAVSYNRVPNRFSGQDGIQLKKAILNRKNSYFYKTARGAHVGDMFMSLIHTTELMNANPFNYLTELLKHAKDVARNPERWMPWNYRETVNPARATQSIADRHPPPPSV
jgi:hypothetical protein